jgi:hypothetical protein
LDGEPVRTIVDEMPWVDIVVSTNTPGDPISDAPRLAEQTRRLQESGRLFVAASGNNIITGILVSNGAWPYYNYNLPPWVVSVARRLPVVPGHRHQSGQTRRARWRLRAACRASAHGQRDGPLGQTPCPHVRSVAPLDGANSRKAVPRAEVVLTGPASCAIVEVLDGHQACLVGPLALPPAPVEPSECGPVIGGIVMQAPHPSCVPGACIEVRSTV